jgi:hypothetical protein
MGPLNIGATRDKLAPVWNLDNNRPQNEKKVDELGQIYPKYPQKTMKLRKEKPEVEEFFFFFIDFCVCV